MWQVKHSCTNFAQAARGKQSYNFATYQKMKAYTVTNWETTKLVLAQLLVFFSPNSLQLLFFSRQYAPSPGNESLSVYHRSLQQMLLFSIST